MTKDEATIIVLEAALVQSHHTISFLHGCLTSPEYEYNYPEQTINRLSEIEKLVKIPDGCYHSVQKPDCPECAKSLARRRLYHEATTVLKSHEPKQTST